MRGPDLVIYPEDSRLSRAFSLVETLVCAAILCVLAGLLFAVMGQSKQKAKSADTLERLKQLSIAAELYKEAHGVHPLGTAPLVTVGLIPKDLCASLEDRTKLGMANEMVIGHGKRYSKGLVTDYRNSFIGAREYNLQVNDLFGRFVESAPTGGWLVEVSTMKMNELPNPVIWSGKYRRLMNDGSVQTKSKVLIPCGGDPNGGVSDCAMPLLFFVDPNPELLEWARSLK